MEYEIDVAVLLLRRLRRIQGGMGIDVSPAADGSCTITDDTDTHIACEGCGRAAGNELANLLVALAPARIVVCDLSCGRCAELSQVLLQVFEDRVSFLGKRVRCMEQKTGTAKLLCLFL